MIWLVLLLQASAVLANAPVDWWSKSCKKLIGHNPASDNAANWTLSSLQERHMGMGDSDDNIECSNAAYILTVWDCIHSGAELMPSIGRSSKQALDESFRYCQWICEYDGDEFMFSRKELDEAYSKTTFKSWDEAADTLTGPFHVNTTLLEPYIQPDIHFHEARAYSEVFSQVIVYFICGVLILQMLINFCVWVFPRQVAAVGNTKLLRLYRKHVTLRPLLGKKLSQKLDLYSTPFPYICLTILVVLNYTFMGIMLNPRNPQPLYPSDSVATGTYLGYRSGFLCMYKLPFVFLFGTRNNIFIWATGWDLAVFNHWHAWLARMVVIDGFIHTGAYVVHFGPEDSMAAWSDAYWTCGFIALLCWTLMAFHGVSWVKKLSHDFFRLCHIALGAASVGTLWVHLAYAHQLKQLWYTLLSVWLFDWVLRCFRMNASGICDAVVEHSSDDFYTVYVRDHSPVRPRPGTHYYIYFWTWPIFWQSHPFTVVECRDGYLKFVFKVHNGMTKVVANRVLASGGSRGFKVGLEGPLGVSFNFKSFDKIVALAAGVGITACYSHLLPWIRNKADRPITVYWAMRDTQLLECFSDEIEALQAAGIDLKIFISGTNTTPKSEVQSEALSQGSQESLHIVHDEKIPRCSDNSDSVCITPSRLKLEEAISSEICGSEGSLAFFACGSPEFNRTAREAVASNICKATHYIQFYEEAFS